MHHRLTALLLAVFLLFLSVGVAEEENLPTQGTLLTDGLLYEKTNSSKSTTPFQLREPDLYFHTAVRSGESLVLMGYDYNTETLSFYQFREGDQALTFLGGGLFYAPPGVTLSEAQQQCERSMSSIPLYTMPDLTHAVSGLCSDGETLYALNDLNGCVFTIQAEDGKLRTTDVCQFDTTGLFLRSYSGQDGDEGVEAAGLSLICVTDGVMVCQRSWAEEDSLLLIDLSDGQVITLPLGDQALYSATVGDGEILLALIPDGNAANGTESVAAADLYAFRVSDASMTLRWAQVPLSRLYGLAWYAKKGEYLSLSGLEVSSTADFQTFTPLVNFPQRSLQLCPLGECILAYSSQAVYVRTPGAAAQNSLRVLTDNEGASAFRQFVAQNPTVMLHLDAIAASEGEEIADKLLSGEVDVVLLELSLSGAQKNASSDWPLDRLLDSGACRSMGDMPVAQAYMDGLNDVYRQAVTRDGECCGVVLSASSSGGYYINRDVQEQMNLIDEDIPSNLVDLCAFITRWNSDYVAQYPSLTPLDATEDYHERILTLMIQEWIGYCQKNDQPLCFQHPVMRQMLTALEAMESDRIEQANQTVNEDESDYRESLLWTDVRTIGNFSNYTTASGDRTFIPMTLTADTAFCHGINEITVALVSPQTQSPELVEALLSCLYDSLTETQRHVLLANCTDPVEANGYAQQVALYEEEIASLQRQMDNAPESRKLTYANRIANLETVLHEYNAQGRWQIAPKTVALYQETLLPACYLRRPCALDTAEKQLALQALCRDYLDGALTQEDFLKAMDALLL